MENTIKLFCEKVDDTEYYYVIPKNDISFLIERGVGHFAKNLLAYIHDNNISCLDCSLSLPYYEDNDIDELFASDFGKCMTIEFPDRKYLDITSLTVRQLIRINKFLLAHSTEDILVFIMPENCLHLGEQEQFYDSIVKSLNPEKTHKTVIVYSFSPFTCGGQSDKMILCEPR